MFETFVRLRGQLMVLDAGGEEALAAAWRAAAPADAPGRPVVAAMAPPGTGRGGASRIAAWRMITGLAGRSFTLSTLDGVDLALAPEGATREIWHPAPFSRLR